MQISPFGSPEGVISGMHSPASGPAREFHQSQLLEEIEPPDSFRRPEWSLTAPLQMPDEALADEPLDSPVNIPAVSEGKVHLARYLY
jgi:hypothetical protein